MTDTIFAVSSGQPPAAIAVIRVSGPSAFVVARTLAGTLPPARTAGLRGLRTVGGELLDRALVLVFPGPLTATGEDLVELHCHGGRAVVAAVLEELGRGDGVRLAKPGEFTRRALTHGRIDLAEAEGLADLLSAETEAQRVTALAASEGRVSRMVGEWMHAIAALSARLEVMIDYADEEDAVTDDAALASIVGAAQALGREMIEVAAAPPVERLRDGPSVVLAGPPNAGKSTLLNLLVEREAAIVSPVAGTTRDRIEAQVVRRGRAYRLTDTAGLMITSDVVEALGVERAEDAVAAADLLVWLGDTAPPREDALWIQARADVAGRGEMLAGRHLLVSRDRSASIDALWSMIEQRCDQLLPRTGVLALKRDQRDACREAGYAITTQTSHLLILAEHYRIGRNTLATITGENATEAMLDALFSRFCLGK